MSVPTRFVTGVGSLPADAEVVDALARLQLNARRLDMGIRLRHASPELQELLSLVGLRDVLDATQAAPGEARGPATDAGTGFGGNRATVVRSERG
jgi:hypothetical protein